MFGGETELIACGRIKYNLELRKKENSSLCMLYFSTLGGCGLQGSWYSVYDSLSRGRIGLLFAKGCDRIAALTPCKKTPSKAFGIHQLDSCLCLIRDVVLMLAQVGYGGQFLTDTRPSKLKREIRDDNKEVYFC